MQRIDRYLLLLAGLTLFTSAWAQAPSELDELASQTSTAVAQANARRVRTAILPSCDLAAQICTDFDARLRAKLQQAIPGVQFVSPNDAVGAEVLVNEGLSELLGEIKLNSAVVNAAQGRTLDEFKATVASMPTCLSCPDPDFPHVRNQKTAGTISLLATITPNGRTEIVTLVKGLDKDLDRVAMKAVKNWQFTPSVRDGKPITTRMPIVIDSRSPSS